LDTIFNDAKKVLNHSHGNRNRKEAADVHVIGSVPNVSICDRYFTIGYSGHCTREIGTGFIGGKSVGMLLARKIWKWMERNDLLNI
jgi:hypothetical protein